MAARHSNTTLYLLIGAGVAAYYFRAKLESLFSGTPGAALTTAANDVWSTVDTAISAATDAASSAANTGATPVQIAAAAQIAATTTAARSVSSIPVSADAPAVPLDPYDPITHPGANYGPNGDMTITQLRDWQQAQTARMTAQAAWNQSFLSKGQQPAPYPANLAGIPLTAAHLRAARTDPAIAFLVRRDRARRGA